MARKSNILPVKTDEVVVYDGVKHVVGNVQLTSDGPILELLPIKAEPVIVHASEVDLPDQLEASRRAKLVGIATPEQGGVVKEDTAKSIKVNIPDNLSKEQATRIMNEVAARIKAAVKA